MGSLNGTYLDGELIEGSAWRPVRCGARLAFGNVELEQWVLEDAGPPEVMAVPVGGGPPQVAESGLLPLPSEQDPDGCVYRDEQGRWWLELDGNRAVPLVDRATFQLRDQVWRFSVPGEAAVTERVVSALSLTQVRLRFGVSRDEEHVELVAEIGQKELQLGARSFYYLLLILARQRLRDREAGLAESSCGWAYKDDLSRALGVLPTQINVDVFRLRQQFVRAGFREAHRIIERRPRTQQIRIGVSDLHVESL